MIDDERSIFSNQVPIHTLFRFIGSQTKFDLQQLADDIIRLEDEITDRNGDFKTGDVCKIVNDGFYDVIFRTAIVAGVVADEKRVEGSRKCTMYGFRKKKR